MPDRIAVASGDFIRNIGFWQNEAMQRPVAITYHGRERLILATPERFQSREANNAATSSALTKLRADSAAVLENLEDGFLVFDGNLQATGSNRAAEAFLGRVSQDLRGMVVDDVFPQPSAAMLRERLVRVARTRKREIVEIELPEGRYLGVQVFPMSSDVGLILRNTTEQHQLRHEAVVGEAWMAALQSVSGIATLELDERLRIQAVNQTFADWTGFDRDGLVGHRLSDLAAADGRRDLSRILSQAVLEGRPSVIAMTLISRKGDALSGTLSIAPVFSDAVARGAVCLWTRMSDANSAQAAAQ